MLSRWPHVIKHKPGLESLADRRWTRKLFFHIIILALRPSYFKDYQIRCDNLRTCLTQSSTQKITKPFPSRTKTFESSPFPHSDEAWGNLSTELRNINLINRFKSSTLNFVRPRENSNFEVHDINGEKLLTRLRFDFSHLMNINFDIIFNNLINPMCSCSKEPKTILHCLLHCDLYSIYRLESLKNPSEENLLKILLYGAEYFISQMNSEILKCTIKFIKKTDRFSGPVFLS